MALLLVETHTTNVNLNHANNILLLTEEKSEGAKLPKFTFSGIDYLFSDKLPVTQVLELTKLTV